MGVSMDFERNATALPYAFDNPYFILIINLAFIVNFVHHPCNIKIFPLI